MRMKTSNKIVSVFIVSCNSQDVASTVAMDHTHSFSSFCALSSDFSRQNDFSTAIQSIQELLVGDVETSNCRYGICKKLEQRSELQKIIKIEST